jgi:hypothetical protein
VTAGLFISDGARREVYFEKPRDNLKTRFGIPSWSAFIELKGVQEATIQGALIVPQ